MRLAWGVIDPITYSQSQWMSPRDVFECELRAAAFQNGVYIAMCNRVGPEGQVIFCGESMVVDPYGAVLAKGTDREALIVSSITPSANWNGRCRRTGDYRSTPRSQS